MVRAQWVCGGAVLAAAEAELFLQLPEPVAVRITTSGGLTLAPQNDLATYGGIGVPSSATFSAVVDFEDPETGATTTQDFTYDSRTTFVASNSGCTECCTKQKEPSRR